MKILWTLPQFIIAKILIVLVGATHKTTLREGLETRVYTTGWRMGISLGRDIIVPEYAHARVHEMTLKHEYGHTVQSEKLGWLYLPVVGVPSLVMNLLTRAGVLRSGRYYERWPESWADRLGEVER